jgi:hypothetical protein
MSLFSLDNMQYFGFFIPLYFGGSSMTSAFSSILFAPSLEYPRCSRHIANGIIPDHLYLEYITTIPFDFLIKLHILRNFPEYFPKCSSFGKRAFVYFLLYFTHKGSVSFAFEKNV